MIIVNLKTYRILKWYLSHTLNWPKRTPYPAGSVRKHRLLKIMFYKPNCQYLSQYYFRDVFLFTFHYSFLPAQGTWSFLEIGPIWQIMPYFLEYAHSILIYISIYNTIYIQNINKSVTNNLRKWGIHNKAGWKTSPS